MCNADAIHPVRVGKDGEVPAVVPRKVMPLREAKVHSTRDFFLSLSSPERIDLLKRLPAEERKLLWNSLRSGERTQNLTPFMIATCPEPHVGSSRTVKSEQCGDTQACNMPSVPHARHFA